MLLKDLILKSCYNILEMTFFVSSNIFLDKSNHSLSFMIIQFIIIDVLSNDPSSCPFAKDLKFVVLHVCVCVCVCFQRKSREWMDIFEIFFALRVGIHYIWFQ